MSSWACTTRIFFLVKVLPSISAMRLSTTCWACLWALFNDPSSNTMDFQLISFTNINVTYSHQKERPRDFELVLYMWMMKRVLTQLPQSHIVLSLSWGASGAVIEMNRAKSQNSTLFFIRGENWHFLVCVSIISTQLHVHLTLRAIVPRLVWLPRNLCWHEESEQRNLWTGLAVWP